MLDMSEIVEHLDTVMGSGLQTPMLHHVSASINVEQAVDEAIALPAAFVLPGNEQVLGTPDTAWQPRQIISEQVTVIMMARNVSDARGQAAAAEMLALSDGVKAALVGWRPTGRGPLVFVGAAPVGFDDQLLVWAETFATRRTLSPVQ